MIAPACFRRLSACLLLLLSLTPLAACGSYALRGTVVSGDTPSVIWVKANDPRLDADGLASAHITVHLDPDRLNPKPIGAASTNGAGQFTLPLAEPGAGLLLMNIEVLAQRQPDHMRITQQLQLPQRGQQLLITLRPGKDSALPRPGNLIDQTLQDAKPFLNP
ncbi:MAG: hypothetical protein V3V20_06935 [Algisphaera sp.]